MKKHSNEELKELKKKILDDFLKSEFEQNDKTKINENYNVNTIKVTTPIGVTKVNVEQTKTVKVNEGSIAATPIKIQSSNGFYNHIDNKSTIFNDASIINAKVLYGFTFILFAILSFTILQILKG